MLDDSSNIEELSESNNSISVDLLVLSKDAFPIYPYKFAIIPTDTVTLKASTSNVFADENTYVFQIDTTDAFNSLFLKETTVKQKGGVLNWPLPFKLQDSTVYYWRVGPYAYPDLGNESSSGGGVKSGKKNSELWRESSFTYINGKNGWSQSHIYQFEEDEFYVMELNRDKRNFDYMQRTRQVDVYNDPYWSTTIENQKIGVQLDGNFYTENGVAYGTTMRVYVIDSLSLNFWETSCSGSAPEHDFGQIDRCALLGKPAPAYAFEFYVSDYEKIYDMIKNKVPNGDYIVLNSYKSFSNFPSWPDSMLTYMESLGASYIKNLTNQQAYSFFVKKGYPSTSVESYQTTYHDTIFVLTTNVYGTWNFGSITSTAIGPSSKWQSIHWDEHAQENNSEDSVRLTVYGLNDTTDQWELIPYLESISPDSILDITNLDTIIDANIYPYIKLSVYMLDDSLYTPAILDRWQVLYDEIPEAALNPAMSHVFYADTLQEGDDIRFSVAIENTSKVDMDSLLVSYYIIDKNNKMHDLSYPRQDSLRAGDTIMSSISFNSLGYKGLNSLWIKVNPSDANNVYDQWEQYHFNNTAQKTFYVSADDENPVLDVTFDGVHIMDGELVSAKPVIVMQLTDENQYLLLNDTSLFDIELTSPSDSVYPLYFMQGGQEIMKFTAGDSVNNTFTIEYAGTFNEDGVYKLKVHATDASENASGSIDYQISFEVINKSTITHIVNYPNPFSTSTRFVFTLTGSDIPDYFKIQIMTVSGRVIREITTDALGAIKIGNNISEFAWDGTDAFGDPLANGVYLYRVITSLNGKEIEHRSEEGIDTDGGVNTNFFKKGIGKMYLMR
jgi:hypothetical protein